MDDPTAYRLNRIRGMLMGAFLGDALGAPHEFYCNRGTVYTGKLEKAAFLVSQYRGRIDLKVGQITDDSEMTLILLRSLIHHNGYNHEAVIRDYIAWSAHAPFMGKNTRMLFKEASSRADPLASYRNKLNKEILSQPEEMRSQSNGALMRCSPLALLPDQAAVRLDVDITNPCTVTYETNRVYTFALYLALRGKSHTEIWTELAGQITHPAVKAVYDSVPTGYDRNLAENKGWCLHGLWCALTVLYFFDKMGGGEGTSTTTGKVSRGGDSVTIYKWLIASHPGSDSDTNACIAGALMGALLGYDVLYQQQAENIAILLAVQPEAQPSARPAYYQPADFYQFTQQLAERFP